MLLCFFSLSSPLSDIWVASWISSRNKKKKKKGWGSANMSITCFVKIQQTLLKSWRLPDKTFFSPHPYWLGLYPWQLSRTAEIYHNELKLSLLPHFFLSVSFSSTFSRISGERKKIWERWSGLSEDNSIFAFTLLTTEVEFHTNGEETQGRQKKKPWVK